MGGAAHRHQGRLPAREAVADRPGQTFRAHVRPGMLQLTPADPS